MLEDLLRKENAEEKKKNLTESYDFDRVCEIVRRNDVYANVSDEEIKKYW